MKIFPLFFVFAGFAMSTPFASAEPYTLLDSSALDFAAPVVYSRANLTEASGGAIVYDAESNAFYGLPPTAAPGTASNWIQLGGTLGGGNSITSSDNSHNYHVESAAIVCSSSASVASQTGSWISGSPSNITGGVCTLTLNAGEFSSAPNCTANVQTGSASPGGNDVSILINATSATSVAIYCDYNNAAGQATGNCTAFTAYVMCMGPHS